MTNELQNVMDTENLEENLSTFYEEIGNICDPLFKRNIQHGTTSTNTSKMNNKWYDGECTEKRKEFFSHLNNYRTNESAENRSSMTKSRTEYKTLLRSKRYQYDKHETEKLVQARYKNAKLYWNMLKNSQNGKNTSLNVSLSQFEQYFKSINNPESVFYQKDDETEYFNNRFLNGELQVMFAELDIDISNEEIKKACSQLTSGRSGGPDKILNEFLKHGFPYLCGYFNALFNKVLKLGYFPSQWTEGYIVPIFKKGDPNLPGNYRGITLLSTLGKLFTRIINNRLNSWAEDYFVYTESQAGFRKNMGTIDNIYVFNHILESVLKQKNKLYVCFVDFTKAFDLLLRGNIFYKLIKYGVRGNMMNTIHSLYCNVKSSIKLQNELSETFICSIGTRQGDCLSPFIFSMYVNDLEE